MKARLVPLFFQSGKNAEFLKRVETVRNLLAEEADILEPVALGADLPEADAVVFPQVLGDAYRQLNDIKALELPLLFITSEFGTVSMWDWEIGSYLRSEGLDPIAPYNLDQTKSVCRALGVKRDLMEAAFLVFQDNPGEGFQPDIFKCFYWWENECTQRMFDKFGITIKKKSFKEFGKRAQQIPDEEADLVWEDWQYRVNLEGITKRARNSALKVYLALKRELEQDSSIRGMGINCLNESQFSDTTPCLAWNMLYEEQGLIWGCEADTVSMLTKYLLHKSLHVPIMMTNLYPFLMGQAALKHERISDFPKIEEPENHLLVAHCGYLGVLPQSFATEWTLRPKVLAIVDDNATAIDARLPVGEMTLAKLHPSFEKITVIEGTLEDYVQYPGSDCLNGAILKVPDGRQLMTHLSSHHYLLMTGHNAATIRMIATVLDLEVEEF
ncbi:MAG: hypothetical protein JW963_09175 [Anaerolineales bacterium]|nr:hypothetical protein [Anaerolineales bacterium]